MTTNTDRKGILSRLWNLPRTTVAYIFDAALRIFSPNTDDYPKIGAQPYQGDPNTDKQHR